MDVLSGNGHLKSVRIEPQSKNRKNKMGQKRMGERPIVTLLGCRYFYSQNKLFPPPMYSLIVGS